MELIERYIFAIKRRLPAKVSEDIAIEIRSLIYDELEGKFGEKEEFSKEEAETVMLEMGHPREVAERYRGDKQYLIGPELFPMYKMIVGIVIAANTLGFVISFIEQCFTMINPDLWQGIKDFLIFLPQIFSSWWVSIGVITIIFALIERFTNFDGKEFISDGWKPRDLPELPEKSEIVRLWEPIVSISFIVIWIVCINSFIYSDGTIVNNFSSITIFPTFNMVALRQYLPLWNLSIGLSLALQIVLLSARKWTFGTRIFEIIIDLFSIFILAVMLNGPSIFEFTSMGTLLSEFGSTIAILKHNYHTVIQVLMVISTIGLVIKIIKVIVNQSRKAKT